VSRLATFTTFELLLYFGPASAFAAGTLATRRFNRRACRRTSVGSRGPAEPRFALRHEL